MDSLHLEVIRPASVSEWDNVIGFHVEEVERVATDSARLLEREPEQVAIVSSESAFHCRPMGSGRGTEAPYALARIEPGRKFPNPGRSNQRKATPADAGSYQVHTNHSKTGQPPLTLSNM